MKLKTKTKDKLKPDLNLLKCLWILPALALFSCEGLNPPPLIPAYMHVKPFTLTTTFSQGSASHRITDAWVGVDNQLLGGFYLPATIPSLDKGSRTVRVLPGVIENGISATREIYPFYKPFEIVLDLADLQVDTITPVTTYKSETQFVFIEDFESSNLFGEDLDGNMATDISLVSAGAFEGQNSARITLIDDFAIASVGTSLRYVLPKDGNPVFLELNYRCEIDFAVGIIGHYLDGSTPESLLKLTLVAREDWNKVYVSLDEEVISLNADLYQIYFRAEKPNSQASANVFLDNVKLLHL